MKIHKSIIKVRLGWLGKSPTAFIYDCYTCWGCLSKHSTSCRKQGRCFMISSVISQCYQHFMEDQSKKQTKIKKITLDLLAVNLFNVQSHIFDKYVWVVRPSYQVQMYLLIEGWDLTCILVSQIVWIIMVRKWFQSTLVYQVGDVFDPDSKQRDFISLITRIYTWKYSNNSALDSIGWILVIRIPICQHSI